MREGEYRRQRFATSIVDVANGQLLDVVLVATAGPPLPGCNNEPATGFNVDYVTLDLSGPYRKAFNEALPLAHQITDPFHLVKPANAKIDECRRRVQNEAFGHRAHKNDPLYRAPSAHYGE